MADQRPSSFIGLIKSDEKLPQYPGTKHQGPVPDPKVPSCLRPQIPIKGKSAGDYWYDMGHKFVDEHGEEFEKTLFIGVPHADNSNSWQSSGLVAITTFHDYRVGLACIMDFAIKKLDLKHRREEGTVASDMQTYKTADCITLSNQIPQQDVPTYRLDDNDPRVKSTRPVNNTPPQNDAPENPLAVSALGIYATEHKDFTREDVNSSMSRVLTITLFKPWGMAKPESFLAGLNEQSQIQENQLMFDRDAMRHLEQMYSYAILWRTAFVGICDGGSVILVEFGEDILRSGFATEQIWRNGLEGGCKMVVLGKEESGKVRATMLGWMLDSLHKMVKNDARIVPSESL